MYWRIFQQRARPFRVNKDVTNCRQYFGYKSKGKTTVERDKLYLERVLSSLPAKMQAN